MNTQRSIGGSAERQNDVDAERERLKRARYGSQGRTCGGRTHWLTARLPIAERKSATSINLVLSPAHSCRDVLALLQGEHLPHGYSAPRDPDGNGRRLLDHLTIHLNGANHLIGHGVQQQEDAAVKREAPKGRVRLRLL